MFMKDQGSEVLLLWELGIVSLSLSGSMPSG